MQIYKKFLLLLPFHKNLNREDVFLLGRAEVVHFLHISVRLFLHILLVILLHILRKSVLLRFLERVDSVPAGVPDNYLGVLPCRLDFLYELFSPFLCKRRHCATDVLSVVLRRETDVGIHYGLLDDRDHLLLPWLDEDGLGIGNSDRSHLWNRCFSAIIIHHYIIEYQRIGLSGTICLEILFKELDSVAHLGFRSVKDFFCFV